MPPTKRNRPTRHTTIYDAVAGTITSHGFTPNSDPHRPPPLAPHPIGPDEALGRRRHAPPDGIPFEDDKPGLPDSLLLRSIHQYAIDFYTAREDLEGSAGAGGRAAMDETALIAIGILLEEEVKMLLGEWGAGALVDQEEWDGWMNLSGDEGDGGSLDDDDDDDEVGAEARAEAEDGDGDQDHDEHQHQHHQRNAKQNPQTQSHPQNAPKSPHRKPLNPGKKSQPQHKTSSINTKSKENQHKKANITLNDHIMTTTTKNNVI
ncbi:hypothetical protein DFH27DRAFT_32957 [Peziza echinospora]|nr:hypothetical protein DFH27DRAFT_32957 [Peziza echinospora]